MKLAVGLRQKPLRPNEVAITGGFVGRRYAANVTGSIKAFDIDRYVAMLETPEHKDWWWIGEQPGKWIESSALISAATGDEALRDRLSGILDRVINAQSSDGYLGITDPSLRTHQKPLRGMDPYEQYFTFHALLTAYEVLHDTRALDAAVRLADYYLRYIGPGKAGFWPSPLRPPENLQTIICKQWTWVPPGTPQSPTLYWQSEIAGHTAHYGWEGTLVLDPILRLCQITGERRFHDFAQWIVESIDAWSGWNAFSRLDDVAHGSAGVHELQPYVHSHTFHMNFLGFLRLYEITGEQSILDKVAGAWGDIRRRQMYVTGGVSAGEHYKPDHQRPLTGDVVETCANMSWMQLTQKLLEITGEPKYADVMEQILFNHVFASQTIDGDSYRYHTPPNGQKPQKYFHGPDCCTSSGHRLVAMLPLFIYATTQDSITVNQYVPSTANIELSRGGRLKLEQTTDFPEKESIQIKLSCDDGTRCQVRLRIPSWCYDARVFVADESPVPATPGTYMEYDRIWNDGDIITLQLPMRPHWIEHDNLPADQNRMAIMRGPVVYSLDTVWWDQPDLPSTAVVDELMFVPRQNIGAIEMIPMAGPYLGPACRATLLTNDGARRPAVFVPFANAGCWYREGESRPDLHSVAFSYAVWLRPEKTNTLSSTE